MGGIELTREGRRGQLICDGCVPKGSTAATPMPPMSTEGPPHVATWDSLIGPRHRAEVAFLQKSQLRQESRNVTLGDIPSNSPPVQHKTFFRFPLHRPPFSASNAFPPPSSLPAPFASHPAAHLIRLPPTPPSSSVLHPPFPRISPPRTLPSFTLPPRFNLYSHSLLPLSLSSSNRAPSTTLPSNLACCRPRTSPPTASIQPPPLFCPPSLRPQRLGLHSPLPMRPICRSLFPPRLPRPRLARRRSLCRRG